MRFIAEQTITNPGAYYDQTGRWTVRDTQPLNPDCATVMNGSERQAKRWARDLNARS